MGEHVVFRSQEIASVSTVVSLDGLLQQVDKVPTVK